MPVTQTAVSSKALGPIEKLRAACLARGASGIKGLARQFKIMDDNENRLLDRNEFIKGCRDFGVQFSDAEMTELYAAFDQDKDGAINFDEFLMRLRPPMSASRINIIQKCFSKMDKTGDGVITIDDLKGTYDHSKHPKFINGEWTKQQVLQKFLDSFEPNESSADGKITVDEFVLYYSGVSASVDDDMYFDLMMRQAFKV